MQAIIYTIGTIAGTLDLSATDATALMQAQNDLTIAGEGQVIVSATAFNAGGSAGAEIMSPDDVINTGEVGLGSISFGATAGDFTVEAAADQCYSSAHSIIEATGPDLTIGDIGGNFLVYRECHQFQHRG